MVSLEIPKLISYSLGGVVSRVVHKDPTINVTLFCMAKGTDISEHATPKTGYVYVLEGKGTFRIEGEELTMAKGVMITLKPGAKHSLIAEENTSFLLTLC